MAFFDPREFEVKPKKELDFLPPDNYIGQIEEVFIYKKDGRTKLGLKFCILFPSEHKNKHTLDWIVVNDENQDEKSQKQLHHGRKRLVALLKSFGMGDRPLNDPQILNHRIAKFLLQDFNNKNYFNSYLELDDREKSLLPKDTLEDIEFDLATREEIPF